MSQPNLLDEIYKPSVVNAAEAHFKALDALKRAENKVSLTKDDLAVCMAQAGNESYEDKTYRVILEGEEIHVIKKDKIKKEKKETVNVGGVVRKPVNIGILGKDF